jgi:hypothetical protein
LATPYRRTGFLLGKMQRLAAAASGGGALPWIRFKGGVRRGSSYRPQSLLLCWAVRSAISWALCLHEFVVGLSQCSPAGNADDG